MNERRLPPEACGRGEEPRNANRKGSRGVVLYPGDAIRFGASTRIYILEGPAEFERDAIKLRRKMEAAAAAASSEPEKQSNDENIPKENNDVGCGWGMADDIIATDHEQHAQVKDHSDLSPLPSIDSFFYSAKHKIPDALHKLHATYNTKMHKLQSIQKESSRIMQKENMGVELTDGQKGQLAKNTERITTLEKEVGNLKDRIEDGMHTVIHGKERVNKRKPRKEDNYNDDDVDDFYDRTASSSKRQRTDNEAQSEQSLIQKWKSLLEDHSKQQRVAAHAFERSTALQNQINNSKEDDEDAFFLKNDLELANENLSKAKISLEEMEKELDEAEYLLKIVNPKLLWDRKEGLIGTNIVKREEASSNATQNNDVVEESDSIMMPPPPVALTVATAASSMPPPPPMAAASSAMPPPPSMVIASSSMHPPPPTATAPSSISTFPEQKQILGPMRPLTNSDSDKQSMHHSAKSDNTTEPQKKDSKKRMGPMRPPAQGTLAALKQVTSKTSQAPDSRQSNGNDQQKKKAPMIANPFEQQKDEWRAPVNQDGSGRTALHDKFKGRY